MTASVISMEFETRLDGYAMMLDTNAKDTQSTLAYNRSPNSSM